MKLKTLIAALLFPLVAFGANTNLFDQVRIKNNLVIGTDAGLGASSLTPTATQTRWALGSGLELFTGTDHYFTTASGAKWIEFLQDAGSNSPNGLIFTSVASGSNPSIVPTSVLGDANLGINIFARGTGATTTSNLTVHGITVLNSNMTFGATASHSITLNAGTTAIPNGHTFGSNLLVLSNSNSRVGIGTGNPQAKLDVFSTTTDQLRVSFATNVYGTVTVPSTTSNLTLKFTGDLHLDGTDNAHRFILGKWNGDLVGTGGLGFKSVSVDADTIVSIIPNGSSLVSQVKFFRASSGSGHMGFIGFDSTGEFNIISDNGLTGASQPINFFTKPDSGTPTKRFEIDENGISTFYTNLIVLASTTLGDEGTAFKDIISTNILIDPPSILAAQQFETNVNVSAALQGASVTINPNVQMFAGIVYDATVLSTGVVTVRFQNVGSLAADPTNILYRIKVVNW